jgi:TPR repeat protein
VKPGALEKSDRGGLPESNLPKMTADREESMLSRAADLMAQNDIAGARLIYGYLANHGSASGAFALAESYDARKWAGRRVAGMSPDAGLAEAWYARAAALGSKEANAMLGRNKP